jgi:hypothetical protein
MLHGKVEIIPGTLSGTKKAVFEKKKLLLQHRYSPAVSYLPNEEQTIKNPAMNESLKDVLLPLTIIGSFGASVIFFARTISDYILKKKMIEKGFVNEDTQAIFKRHAEENKYSSLKWGLIIFFAGLSLIIMEYIPYERESPLPYGLFAVFVSLGFLIYYILVKKELR